MKRFKIYINDKLWNDNGVELFEGTRDQLLDFVDARGAATMFDTVVIIEQFEPKPTTSVSPGIAINSTDACYRAFNNLVATYSPEEFEQCAEMYLEHLKKSKAG